MRVAWMWRSTFHHKNDHMAIFVDGGCAARLSGGSGWVRTVGGDLVDLRLGPAIMLRRIV